MQTHHVFFWLKADITEEQKIEFKTTLETLGNIETVKSIYIGTPAPIDRPVVDKTYSYSLLIFLDDMAGHDVYQTHPIHLAFIEKCRAFWDRVLIYDSH